MPTTRGDLPDFVVIGAQRAGTTTLFEHLRQHPDIFLPSIKELSFFIDGARWDMGPDWYQGMFAPARPGQLRGDISPGYAMHPARTGAVEHLADASPSVRIVYSLRDPIERLLSAYWLMRRYGQERRPLDVVAFDSRYLAASLYGYQLDRYLRRFDREQILVTVAERLFAEPGVVLDEILTHVGLRPGWRPPDVEQRHNANTALPREPRGSALLGLAAMQRRGWLKSLQSRDLLRWRIATRPLTITNAISTPVLAALKEIITADLERLCGLLGWASDPWDHLKSGERGDSP